MPPKQRVDLDLDALAPPNRTVLLRGKVYELPGDIPITTVIEALRVQTKLQASLDEDPVEGINELLEIVWSLFREVNPDFEPIPLSMTQVMEILGLILSGMNVSFEDAVQEAIVGLKEEAAEGSENPPTRQSRKSATSSARGSRSGKLSPVAS